MRESKVDDKWRIAIPSEVREGLRKGQVLLVERDGECITIKPCVDIGKFEWELKGCIKGSRMSHGKLKEMWGTSHVHD